MANIQAVLLKCCIIIFILHLFSSCATKPAIVRAISDESCNCITTGEHTGRYKPPLNFVMPYDKFTTATDWHFKSKDDYLKIYASKIRGNASAFSDNSTSAVLLSNDPIVLSHPDDAFSLNLTACNNENHYYEIPVYLNYSNRTIDLKSFNRTAAAYYELMLNHRKFYDSKEALVNYWTRIYEYDAAGFIELINNLNNNYNLNIASKIVVDEYEGFIENLDKEINTVIESITTANIDLQQFTLEKYIVDNGSTTPLNDKEEKNIQRFFYSYNNENFTTNWANENLIRPQYSLFTETDDLGFIIDSHILSSTIKNSNTTILIKTKELRFSNNGGLSINTKQLCNAAYNLLGTEIKIQLKDVTVHSPSRLEKLESDDREFSGMLVHDAIIIIPYKNGFMYGTGDKLKINNHGINGSFYIKKDDIKLNTRDLKNILTKNGLSTFNLLEKKDRYIIELNY